MSADLINYLAGFVNRQRLAKFEKVLYYRTRYINLVCEDIYQGHNASALIRTCDCFGIQDFHIIEKKNSFEINDEVALGASNWLNIYRHNTPGEDFHKVFGSLKARGYRIVATTPHRNGVGLTEFDLDNGPVSLVFGTEKEGLSEEIIEYADEYVSIDMFGFTQSFNVSVSAGIILHHLRMKLNNSRIDWHLNDDEKMAIKLDWLRNSIKRSDLIEKKFIYRKNQGNAPGP